MLSTIETVVQLLQKTPQVISNYQGRFLSNWTRPSSSVSQRNRCRHFNVATNLSTNRSIYPAYPYKFPCSPLGHIVICLPSIYPYLTLHASSKRCAQSYLRGHVMSCVYCDLQINKSEETCPPSAWSFLAVSVCTLQSPFTEFGILPATFSLLRRIKNALCTQMAPEKIS